ncbi:MULTISPECIES: hypothetical protein [Enterobacteriaceae]|uniref:hypothetical protein n=1 Tax=Enterobacteriaceae TaxID=543 RepID=UPI0019009A5F|nr:hypothetical protein [Citrobacter cronae]MBJ8374892.1 hypothetical protein [Citrobacter cronae]
MDPQLEYATKRIVELENPQLLDVNEIVWLGIKIKDLLRNRYSRIRTILDVSTLGGDRFGQLMLCNIEAC